MKVTVAHGQTIWDLALQCYGSVEGVFAIMQDNPSVNLETELVAGQVLLINQAPTNAAVLKYYTDRQLVPSSGVLSTDLVVTVGDFNTDFNFDFSI